MVSCINGRCHLWIAAHLVVVSQVKEQLVPILQNYDTKAQVNHVQDTH